MEVVLDFGENLYLIDSLISVTEALEKTYDDLNETQRLGLFNRAVMGFLLIQRVIKENELQATIGTIAEILEAMKEKRE